MIEGLMIRECAPAIKNTALSVVPCVLVVDDDQMNIEVMKAMLDQENIAFDIAFRGSMALSCIEQRIDEINQGRTKLMYKVIFLDYSMPDMDGPKVATEIRKMVSKRLRADYRQSPYICCCTAYTDASYKR